MIEKVAAKTVGKISQFLESGSSIRYTPAAKKMLAQGIEPTSGFVVTRWFKTPEGFFKSVVGRNDHLHDSRACGFIGKNGERIVLKSKDLLHASDMFSSGHGASLYYRGCSEAKAREIGTFMALSGFLA